MQHINVSLNFKIEIFISSPMNRSVGKHFYHCVDVVYEIQYIYIYTRKRPIRQPRRTPNRMSPIDSQAAQGAVRLEGDVITANGSILSGQIGNHGDTISLDDEASVCSCRCGSFQRKRRRPRFTVRRSPGKISHLLPMQQLSALNMHGGSGDDGSIDMIGDFVGDSIGGSGSDMHPQPFTPLHLQPLYHHRASI